MIDLLAVLGERNGILRRRDAQREILAFLIGLPAAALAQSAIAGIVRDTSGAVLPGVTVEAASPVLIEKSRAATTDGEGRFQIVDLRPGTYTVTFTLEGFSAFKRDGIELPSNFTATVKSSFSFPSLLSA